MLKAQVESEIVFRGAIATLDSLTLYQGFDVYYNRKPVKGAGMLIRKL